MFVSMNWIKDFVDLDGFDMEELIQRFTLSTAEVEGIEYKGRDVNGVVVGEIIQCEDHPDSDHLHVLKVDAGSEVFDVVCGAPNARAGIKTAFAKVGGNVCGMKIKPAKLRGVTSNGMCCSAKEIGISDDHSGIMELDASLPNGTDIKEIYPIDDVVFEVDNKSLTNRPDLWGHYGIAREFAALVDRPLKPLPLAENPYTGDAAVDVAIKDEDKCYRYSAVRVENITEHVSSNVMQVRLYYCGTRAINLLADITNYIMLELGQPMHAFNGDKVDRIVVSTPDEPIKFTTLDGNEHDITTDTLMIYNDKTPVGIAGIMGGLDSEITDDTNSLVLESANFDAVSIRKSASRMALRTDASARYEKTLDPEMTMLAVKRFLKLLFEVDGGCRCVSKITDIYVKKYPIITIPFNKQFVDRYTGIDISSDRIEKTLLSLGFEVERSGDDFKAVVPSYRATKDVSMQADIVEEITRIYGYDNFEIKTTYEPLLPARKSDRKVNENNTRDLLVKNFGLHEVHSRIWCDPDDLRTLGLAPEDNVRLLGSSEEKGTGIIRTSMMQSLLPFVYKNRSFSDTFGIFEIGRIVRGTKDNGEADERRMCAVALYSKEKSEKSLYMEGVDIVNTLISELKHSDVTYSKTTPAHAWQHPKNTSNITVGDTSLGVINTIHPATLAKIAKNCSVVCIEIDMDILDEIKACDLEFNEPSRFPAVEYDLSLVVPEGVRFEDMQECWNKKDIPELSNVKVIDIYDSADTKSITLRFSFVLSDRTLTGEEVQARIDDIISKLADKKVSLRV
ncbi:MAG: phenylalanine--tRNA ligase subunit beta [Lachnospiraceae bacterium]|nr:phenylalanine--tRNA ligase subunit beta [Lachnospiraceae bacterium]